MFWSKEVAGLIGDCWTESLMNRTEPSQKPKLAPPGWKLDAADTYRSELIPAPVPRSPDLVEWVQRIG